MLLMGLASIDCLSHLLGDVAIKMKQHPPEDYLMMKAGSVCLCVFVTDNCGSCSLGLFPRLV